MRGERERWKDLWVPGSGRAVGIGIPNGMSWKEKKCGSVSWVFENQERDGIFGSDKV